MGRHQPISNQNCGYVLDYLWVCSTYMKFSRAQFVISYDKDCYYYYWDNILSSVVSTCRPQQHLSMTILSSLGESREVEWEVE